MMPTTQQHEKKITYTRVRFETKVIAPAFLPDYCYTPSVLAHASVLYTALVPESPQDSLDTTRVSNRILDAWPDARLIAMEKGVTDFRQSDMSLTGYVFGTVCSSEIDSHKEKSIWYRLTRRWGKTMDVLDAEHAPSNPLGAGPSSRV